MDTNILITSYVTTIGISFNYYHPPLDKTNNATTKLSHVFDDFLN
jgi:hypothetical protein